MRDDSSHSCIRLSTCAVMCSSSAVQVEPSLLSEAKGMSGDVKGQRDFLVGGQEISRFTDTRTPGGWHRISRWWSAQRHHPLAGQRLGQPMAVALVKTRWAWCSSRSRVAVASVLGMIWSNPLG
jgi:hypothetical protein